MIAFEKRDFERREALLAGGLVTSARHYDSHMPGFTGRTVPPLDVSFFYIPVIYPASALMTNLSAWPNS